MEKELVLVVGYIMYADLLEGTKYDGSFFYKIDNVMKIAKEFILWYPPSHKWEDEELDWDETIETFVKSNYETIINDAV